MRRADDIRPDEPLAHGAYVCLRARNGSRRLLGAVDVAPVAAELGFAGEFEAPEDAPLPTIGLLRRVSARAGDVVDDTLLDADAVVHVCAPEPGPVDTFCAALGALLPGEAESYVLRGVLRPMRYTGSEMYNWSYGHRVLQQP